MKNNKKGFTLVEMLVVIAIIAVLVAIIVPTALGATAKAKAATDAANLRSVLGEANTQLIEFDINKVKEVVKAHNLKSKLYPDAVVKLGYREPAVYDVFYVLNGNYYNIDYFADFAQNGESSKDISQPDDFEIIDVNDEK